MHVIIKVNIEKIIYIKGQREREISRFPRVSRAQVLGSVRPQAQRRPLYNHLFDLTQAHSLDALLFLVWCLCRRSRLRPSYSASAPSSSPVCN